MSHETLQQAAGWTIGILSGIWLGYVIGRWRGYREAMREYAQQWRNL